MAACPAVDACGDACVSSGEPSGRGIPSMMKRKFALPSTRFELAAAALFLLPVVLTNAQNAPGIIGAPATPARGQRTQPSSMPAAAAPAAATPAETAAEEADRAKAYYHAALAAVYEDAAFSQGQPADLSRAIEEYKYALNADPGSAALNDELASLYFRAGRVQDAEAIEQSLLKTNPNDINAHKLLGRIYLSQLGQQQNSLSSSLPSGDALNKAIAEFKKIIALQPDDVEDRLVLGQLYTINHQTKQAEETFASAQAIQPDSEDVVLNLARLYAESGDLAHAATAIESVPLNERTAKMEFTLGAIYDQMKQPAKAIAAYQQAAKMDPGNLRVVNTLAHALLDNNQLGQALKQYQKVASGDPGNGEAFVHIAEILRRQGKYQDALSAAQKALAIDPTSLEAGYNEGLLYDVLGEFDKSVRSYQSMVDLLSHANGAYTSAERTNRSIFLDRLGNVYLEQNQIDKAIATYQKMIAMGGDSAVQGYQDEVDAYRTAKEYSKALEAARKAVAANPKNRDLKLLLAGELADQGQVDAGFAMAKGLLKNTPADRSVWLAIAQMDIRLKRWKDASQALDKAEPLATKKEDRVYVLFLRGELAERQKHIAPAEKYFQQVLALDPSNAMTLNYLGYMLADRGMRLPEALGYIRKAVSLDPGNAAYLDSLGWVYYKMGQYDLAEPNMRSAVARDQTDPTVHMHLGDLYEKTGRIRLAVQQWQLSLSEFARSDPADFEPGDVAKVQKMLDSARVKIAKEDSAIGRPKSQDVP